MQSIEYKSIPNSPGGTAIAKYGNYLYSDEISSVFITSAKAYRNWRKNERVRDNRQMAVSNGKLYLTVRNFGLWIFSLEDPASTKHISRFDTVELATGIAAAGDMVFVSERIFEIEIIDCSDPLHPKHYAMIRTDEAQSAIFHNGVLYTGG